jgi:hypothetical protein
MSMLSLMRMGYQPAEYCKPGVSKTPGFYDPSSPNAFVGGLVLSDHISVNLCDSSVPSVTRFYPSGGRGRFSSLQRFVSATSLRPNPPAKASARVETRKIISSR